MRFRIHWEAYGSEDTVDIEGESVEDCQGKVAEFFRGRHFDKDSQWSEEIK